MQRRHFLFFAPLLPSALFAPRFLHARGRQATPPHNLRDETNRLNELASNIHTIDDARRFIDAIAELFSDQLPPAWTTASLRSRLAQGEFLAATDPQKRLPEEHLAQTWNAFIATIHAPDDTRVTSAEIHNLRDSFFTEGRLMWDRGYRNFWLLPSIFSTQPDGTLAPGCRVVESLRLFWDLANTPQNLRAARQRAANGVLTSDQMKHAQHNPESVVSGRVELRVEQRNNPVEDAERLYIRDNGMRAFTNTVETMLDNLLHA